jgi:hypothetical protein
MILKIKEFDVLIDDDEYITVSSHTWTPSIRCSRGSKQVYFTTWVYNNENKRKMIYLHRFLMGLPKGCLVDHVNGNTLDNTKRNLRLCTAFDNSANRKIHANNKSGYKGVYKTKNNTWRATINNRGRLIYLGHFKTPELAYEAYCKASKEYHGGFGRIK